MTKLPTPEEAQELKTLLAGFLTVNEAAKILGIKPPALRSRIKHNTVLAARTPTGVLIPKEEVERLQHLYGDPASDIDTELTELADA